MWPSGCDSSLEEDVRCVFGDWICPPGPSFSSLRLPLKHYLMINVRTLLCLSPSVCINRNSSWISIFNVLKAWDNKCWYIPFETFVVKRQRECISIIWRHHILCFINFHSFSEVIIILVFNLYFINFYSFWEGIILFAARMNFLKFHKWQTAKLLQTFSAKSNLPKETFLNISWSA